MEFNHLSILTSVFESTADGLLLVDNNGKVIMSNSRFQELWKIDSSVLESKDDNALISSILHQLIHPDLFLKRVEDLYQTDEYTSRDVLEFKDGRVFERYSQPLKSFEKRVGRIWSFRDITEQRKSQEVFSSIAELSPDIISIIGANGELVFNSSAAERIHGYSKEDLQGINTFDNIHPEDRDLVSQTITDLIKDPTVVSSVQYRYLNKDTTYRWMEATASNQFDNPLIGGLVTISRDISLRKHLEEELNSSLSLRDEFISIASHELKTPVTSLKLRLQMIQKACIGDSIEIKTETVSSLLSQVQTLQDLIEGLLSDSQIRRRQLILHFEENNLSETLENILRNFKDMMILNNCVLETNIEKNIAGSFDKGKIEQVFNNLISNALKFAPGKKIIVSLTCETKVAVFSVTDFGPGIPSDKHEIIFNRFERNGTSSYTTGLGIGLYIAKGIIEGHGGKISIESAVGSGSRFEMRIPIK